jgi:hypothetical protein
LPHAGRENAIRHTKALYFAAWAQDCKQRAWWKGAYMIDADVVKRRTIRDQHCKYTKPLVSFRLNVIDYQIVNTESRATGRSRSFFS